MSREKQKWYLKRMCTSRPLTNLRMREFMITKTFTFPSHLCGSWAIRRNKVKALIRLHEFTDWSESSLFLNRWGGKVHPRDFFHHFCVIVWKRDQLVLFPTGFHGRQIPLKNESTLTVVLKFNSHKSVQKLFHNLHIISSNSLMGFKIICQLEKEPLKGLANVQEIFS